MVISRKLWAETDRGKAFIFKMENKNGVELDISNFGGYITSWKVPVNSGKKIDIVLGYKEFQDYWDDDASLGSIVGRCANRILDGRFSLNGENVQLSQNIGDNHLHGGFNGFSQQIWISEFKEFANSVSLILKHRSPSGTEGYPGTMDVKVVYTLNNENELTIEYFAETDEPTIVNLTNHAYFNLNGYGDILDHELKIAADGYTPMTAQMVPTGEIAEVKNSPFDFSKVYKIGSRIGLDNEQLILAKGYDHNYILNRKQAYDIVLSSEESGISIKLNTSQPGVQLYSGNFLNEKYVGREGEHFVKHSAVCLETQHFPDAVHYPNFPSIKLNPDEKYVQKTVYKIESEGLR